MKNIQIILLFIWITRIVNNQSTTVSPLKANCECVNFQHCHDGLMNYANEFIFDYRTNKCKTKETCCYHTIESMDEKDQLVKPKDKHDFTLCGVRNSSIPMIGSRHSQPGEYPWMAVVLEKIKSEHNYLSGGSIIHPRVILTTAHRLYDTKEMSFNKKLAVVVGINVIQDNGLIVDVQTILPHENFTYVRSHNNIALLLLEKDLILGPTIRTVCLPPLNVKFESKMACVATGFGKEQFSVETLTTNLKKVNLPLLSNENCQQKIRTHPRSSPYFILDDSLLCAGGMLGADTCEGDGGSPLICRNKYYYQVGIVAYGIGCFDEYPAVYTNVTHFYGWITNNFVKLGLDTKTFTPI